MVKQVHFLVFCLFSIQIAIGQTPVVDKTYEIFELEKRPEFPSGDAGLSAYFSKNLRYPALAREDNIQGTVIVNFMIDSTGAISNAQCVKSIGSGCDEEALRVIKAMPKWIPGVVNHKKVKVMFTIPIRFQLTDEDLTLRCETIFYNDLSEKTISPKGDPKSLEKYLSTAVSLSKSEKKSIKGKKMPLLVIVETDGSLAPCGVYSSIDKAITDKYCKALSDLGNWTPGKKDGNLVCSQVDLEIPIK
jgi:TonB family protein